MAQKKVRNRVGVATTSMAVAALLVGPALTWGLDVPTGGSTTPVTTAVQGAVTTTQQTVNTTVTNVQSTVQATVEQAPAAVQQTVSNSAPASSAPPPAAAPKQAITRTVQKAVSAPKQSASRQAAPRSRRSSAPLAGTVQTASRGASAVKGQVRAAVTKRKAAAGTSPSTQAPASTPAAAHCGGLPLDGILPASLNLSALLSIACNAAETLNPAGADAAGDTTLPSLSFPEVLDLVAAKVSALRARMFLPLSSPRNSNRQPVFPVGAKSSRANALGSAGGTAVRPGAVAGWSPAPLLPATATHNAASASAAGHGHHGIFSQRVDGTKGITLVLLIDSILLGLLVLWRAARRWVVPRFA